MNYFFQKMHVLLRAERAILRINLQTVAKQIILYAVGIVLILLAVAALNVAIYVTLSETYGRGAGAFIVSAINAILAVFIMIVANRTKPGPEIAMATEIRDLAVSEINTDVENVRQNLNEIKTDVEQIRSGFSGLLGGGGGSSFGLLNFAPLLDLLISSLRKSK